MKTGNSNRLAGLAVLALCSTALFAGGAVATQAEQPAADDPSFVVDLQDDGTATVTVRYTFDLDSDDEQTAFEDLRTDEDALAAFRDRFDSRLREVAADAGNTTGREMSVSGVTVDTERLDGTGVVTISLTWDGLAATENEQLTVTEPFASGFEPDRPLYVTAPEGYEYTSVTPGPDQQATQTLVWTAGSDLTGFEAVAATTEETGESEANGESGADSSAEENSDDGTDDSGPGFGLVAAVVGILAVARYTRRQS